MRNVENNFSASLSLSALKRYLSLNGWRDINTSTRGTTLYSLVIGQSTLEIFLPTDMNHQSAERRVSEALRTLSQISDQPIDYLIRDIRSVSSDIIRSMIPSSIVDQESIDLGSATDFINNLRNLLSATANTELLPATYFSRTRPDALKYANDCRFGHTFRGSFGFTIESPVPQNSSPMLNIVEQNAPFERRVVERIARGLKDVHAALEKRDPSPIIENFHSGFSANICEDLISLYEASQYRTLKIDLTFSPEWHLPSDLLRSLDYELSPEHLELVGDAAKKLRHQEMERHLTIYGPVTKLRSDVNPSDLLSETGKREITIVWRNQSNPEANVKVMLSPKEYLEAVDAHKSGRTVKVSGSLERTGKTWHLNHPTDFAVLP